MGAFLQTQDFMKIYKCNKRTAQRKIRTMLDCLEVQRITFGVTVQEFAKMEDLPEEYVKELIKRQKQPVTSN